MTLAQIKKWPLLLFGSSLLMLISVFFLEPSPFRSLVTLWFLFLCPGLAFMQLLDLSNTNIILSLSIALSLALNGLVAGIMVYFQIWNPMVALYILVGWSIFGAVLGQIGVSFNQK